MASALLTLLKAIELSKKAGSLRKTPGKIKAQSQSGRLDIDVEGTALEHDVPGKFRVNAIEEEVKRLKAEDPIVAKQPIEVISDIAEQNVNAELAKVKPKRSFVGAETQFAVDPKGVATIIPSKTGVAGRKRVQRGRRDAIIRGEQKYMPRGNKAVIGF